jgi:hypothetical protein
MPLKFRTTGWLDIERFGQADSPSDVVVSPRRRVGIDDIRATPDSGFAECRLSAHCSPVLN